MGKSLYKFYCSLLKSTDFINLENVCEYFATKSLLVVGQVPPPVFIWCCKIFLWLSNILQSYICILGVLLTGFPHCRGTLDYLLIWTCEDMILFSQNVECVCTLRCPLLVYPRGADDDGEPPKHDAFTSYTNKIHFYKMVFVGISCITHITGFHSILFPSANLIS